MFKLFKNKKTAFVSKVSLATLVASLGAGALVHSQWNEGEDVGDDSNPAVAKADEKPGSDDAKPGSPAAETIVRGNNGAIPSQPPTAFGAATPGADDAVAKPPSAFMPPADARPLSPGDFRPESPTAEEIAARPPAAADGGYAVKQVGFDAASQGKFDPSKAEANPHYQPSTVTPSSPAAVVPPGVFPGPPRPPAGFTPDATQAPGTAPPAYTAEDIPAAAEPGLLPTGNPAAAPPAALSEGAPAAGPGAFSPTGAPASYEAPRTLPAGLEPPPAAASIGDTPAAGDYQPQPAAAPPAGFPASSEPAAGAPSTFTPGGSLRPAPTRTASADMQGTGRPGAESLEGAQTPSLSITKVAPPEVQVGKAASFDIRIQNVGRATASDIVVRDVIPAGTRFVDATPQATRDEAGNLVWNINTLKPGEESTISMQLVPLSEGEIGSVATVSFAAQASARTVSTRPRLVIKHTGPQKMLIGESGAFEITISNPGTGVAKNVLLEEDVPEGLSHPAGRELEYEIGTLKPGETRKLELTLKATKPGAIQNTIVVRGDGNLVAEDTANLQVTAPELAVDITGPKRRYLQRQATYSIAVSNPGTAAAQEIELVAHLPKGFKFISTNNAGQYDATQHTVIWGLEQLPAKESGAVSLTVLPVEPGDQKLRVESTADLNLAKNAEHGVLVEGLAELFFQVADQQDPIETGADTVYTVNVTNQGSKTASNIVVAAQLPAALQPVGGEGPTRFQIQGQQIIFQPLTRLAPKDSVVFRIQARGRAEGDHRVRVQLSSDEIRTPVIKEESTRVYSDR